MRMASRKQWFGAACAAAVLCIWSSFILVARSSAARTLTPFDLAFVRFLFSGTLVLPFAIVRAARSSTSPKPMPSIFGGLMVRQVAVLGAPAGLGYFALAHRR